MGSALGHILANVIMTELENKILKVLIESGKLKFYIRHVDDTLLLAKEDGIKYIFDMFSTFHKNLKFTMNRFEENNVHSLDITIDKTDTGLYYKLTHAGRYSGFNYSLPWNYENSWIKSFYHSARIICSSTEKFKSQFDKIEFSILWNSYPGDTMI